MNDNDYYKKNGHIFKYFVGKTFFFFLQTTHFGLVCEKNSIIEFCFVHTKLIVHFRFLH